MAEARSLAFTISGCGTAGECAESDCSLKGDDKGLEARLPYNETAADAVSEGDDVGLGWLARTLEGLPMDAGLVSIGERGDLTAIGDATVSSCSSSCTGCSGGGAVDWRFWASSSARPLISFKRWAIARCRSV